MDEWIDAESRVERARELYEEGRWAEAAAELRAAIDANPGNSTWYFNLGLTLEAMNDFPRAREAYEAALKLDPEDVETLNCLGVNLTRLGKYAESLKCFQQIEKLDATYEPSYCNRIVTYCEIDRHDEAEVMFYLARLFKDECPLCYYNIGTSLYARDQVERAIYCWKKALELDPNQPQAHARLAETYWTQGDLDEACKHYQAEMALDGEDANMLLDFGELLLEMDDEREAESLFRKALEVSPQNVSAHFGLGEVALKRERLHEAMDRFRLVIKLDPSMSGTHAKLARVLVKQGKINEAAKHVVIELRQSGADPQILQELGELLIEAQLSRHASKVLSRLVELRPEDPYAHHNLAVSYFMMGRYDEGIRHCQVALKHKPEYPLATYNLALAYLQKGDRVKARQYAARAMEMDPDDKHIVDLARELGSAGLWSRIRRRFSKGASPSARARS
jgi:tetratricopeptide (TPR) repeat protein